MGRIKQEPGLHQAEDDEEDDEGEDEEEGEGGVSENGALSENQQHRLQLHRQQQQQRYLFNELSDEPIGDRSPIVEHPDDEDDDEEMMAEDLSLPPSANVHASSTGSGSSLASLGSVATVVAVKDESPPNSTDP